MLIFFVFIQINSVGNMCSLGILHTEVNHSWFSQKKCWDRNSSDSEQNLLRLQLSWIQRVFNRRWVQRNVHHGGNKCRRAAASVWSFEIEWSYFISHTFSPVNRPLHDNHNNHVNKQGASEANHRDEFQEEIQ